MIASSGETAVEAAWRRREALVGRFRAVRARTRAIAAPLSAEDAQAQSMPDASPAKWHLAHVTWFFETFVLERFEAGFRPHHPAFRVLFNSYYQGVGDRHPRPRRGQITRPTLAEVLAYRDAVDARMEALMADSAPGGWLDVVELGLEHEQQHQELLLTDILHLFSCNPLAPAYQSLQPSAPTFPFALAWQACEAGMQRIGHDGPGFAFDNELPRHATWLVPHALATRPVNNGEWADFIADGGYRDPRHWLSAGWDWVTANAIEAPLYWRRAGAGGWCCFTLCGEMPLDAQAPVAHISFYEAEAYARWRGANDSAARGARLPTEAEWEVAAAAAGPAAIASGHFADSGVFRPLPAHDTGAGLQQIFGDVWEWTSSAYSPYPGFRPWEGAVGEYNGKFMVNQYVLRGGSCATPREHIRATYRNFFPAEARWQFSGVRLARDLDP